MTKWEYCLLFWHVADTSTAILSEDEIRDFEKKGVNISRDGNTMYASSGQLDFFGNEDDNKDVSDLRQTIAELGIQGWELVSYESIKTDIQFPGTSHDYYFKRPILE